VHKKLASNNMEQTKTEHEAKNLNHSQGYDRLGQETSEDHMPKDVGKRVEDKPGQL
jgi:hypothetical protein